IEPVYEREQVQRPLSIVVTAEDDNLPWEGVEKLFDGDRKTKWLDLSTHSNRSSWAQWYYVEQKKPAVIRTEVLTSIQPRLPRIFKLQLNGVMIGATSNRIAFLD